MGKSPEQIVRDGMRALREYGWRKDDLGNRRTGFCLVGALRYAANHDEKEEYLPAEEEEYVEAFTILQARIRKLFPERAFEMIAIWNDSWSTSQKDINKLIESFLEEEMPPVALKNDPAHEYDIR